MIYDDNDLARIDSGWIYSCAQHQRGAIVEQRRLASVRVDKGIAVRGSAVAASLLDLRNTVDLNARRLNKKTHILVGVSADPVCFNQACLVNHTGNAFNLSSERLETSEIENLNRADYVRQPQHILYRESRFMTLNGIVVEVLNVKTGDRKFPWRVDRDGHRAHVFRSGRWDLGTHFVITEGKVERSSDIRESNIRCD